jgi:hypothetical protein
VSALPACADGAGWGPRNRFSHAVVSSERRVSQTRTMPSTMTPTAAKSSNNPSPAEALVLSLLHDPGLLGTVEPLGPFLDGGATVLGTLWSSPARQPAI